MNLCFALQFGRAIVCSDAAAEAARYGFTAVDRPEGFLVLAIVSLGEEITEITSLPEVVYYELDFTASFLHFQYEVELTSMCWDRTQNHWRRRRWE